MSAIEWSRAVDKVITQRWRQLKKTLVMKDFAGYLIEKGVISLDYWMGLKAKQIAESERTEDFLFLVIKFDRQKYQHFLDPLRSIGRKDLYRELFIPLANKTKTKEKKIGGNKDSVAQEATPEMAIGHSSADLQSHHQNPTIVSEVPQATSKDGHSDSSQDTISGDILVAAKTSELQNSVEKQRYQLTQTNKTDQSSEQPSCSTLPINRMRHVGIGTAEEQDTVQYPKVTANKDDDKKTTATRIINVEASVGNEPCRLGVVNAMTITTLDSETSASSTSTRATLRSGTTQSRSDLLDAREKQLKRRDSELDIKQRKLEEQEETLKTKEKELLTRENSMLAMTPTTSESIASTPNLPRSISMSTGSFSSTHDSEILSYINEQLSGLKTDQEEIKLEHTTYCRNPKDDYMYVKRQEFLVAEQLRKSGEQKIENLHSKLEHLNHEVGDLQTNVDSLTKEKNLTEQ